MNLLHRLADPTIKLDDFDRYFLSFLRELNYNFGLQVYCKRSDTKYSMVDERGLFYGFADINRNDTEETMDYEFVSTQFIQKERGRGVNGHTRKSNSLGRLIKQLKNDFKKASNTPHYVEHSYESTKHEVSTALKHSDYFRPTVNNVQIERALLDHAISGKTFPPEYLERCKKYLIEHEQQDEKSTLYDDELRQFDKAYVLYTQAYAPPMFGIVEKEGNKFKFQAGVNCYSTLEELPLEFITAYKMWLIGTENDPKAFDFKSDRRGNRDASMFHHPLHECMVCDDTYNENFGVFVAYSNMNYINSTQNILMVPYVETQA
jgi:hypothetical protein